MLRITVNRQMQGVGVVVEGRLRGPWVEELKKCLEALRAEVRGRGDVGLSVDLSGVMFMDESGRELLRTLYHDGVELEARGLLGSILDEIAFQESGPIMRTWKKP